MLVAVCAARIVAFFEPPDGAVWRYIIKYASIAQFNEISDCAAIVHEAVQVPCRSYLEEVTRSDENQLAMVPQVLQALVNEKHVEVRSLVEAFEIQLSLGPLRDVPKARMRRIADYGRELARYRVVEEIAC